MTQILKIKHDWPEDVFPVFATEGSACFDIPSNATIGIACNHFKLVGTGIWMEIPKGYCLQIYPRSGFANKKRVIIPNSPGIIDSDYRGEIKVGLLNLGNENIYIKRGDRIAQARLVPLIDTLFKKVDELSDTTRGEGGFGSTGMNKEIITVRGNNYYEDHDIRKMPMDIRQKKICWNCNGTGKIEKYFGGGDHLGAGTSPNSYFYKKICPKCNGTGCV